MPKSNTDRPSPRTFPVPTSSPRPNTHGSIRGPSRPMMPTNRGK